MKIIYCAGELGRVVLDILKRRDINEDIIFVDNNSDLDGTTIHSHDVVGGSNPLSGFDINTCEVIIAFADHQSVRLELTETVREVGFPLFSAIDIDTTVSSTATIGDGVIINAQSYVGPDAVVSDAVVIDSAVNISHDVELKTGATVAPNATVAGGVTIGYDAFVGAGATILDDITVGDGAIVGAGAVVTSSVPPETTVVGVPANPITDEDPSE